MRVHFLVDFEGVGFRYVLRHVEVAHWEVDQGLELAPGISNLPEALQLDYEDRGKFEDFQAFCVRLVLLATGAIYVVFKQLTLMEFDQGLV